jgi:HK97 family phage major capsid protein
MPSEYETQLKETIERVGENFDEFQKHYNKRFQEIEHKANMLVFGNPVAGDRVDHQSLFHAAVKSRNPGRADMLGNFDYAEFKKAFSKYMRFGEHSLTGEEHKAMSAGVDPDGGYLTTSEMSREIIQVEQANSVVRRIARVLPMGRANLEIPAALTRPATGWVGETDSRGDTEEPALGQIDLVAKEIYAQPKATQKLLDDSEFDVEAFLAEQIGLAFAGSEDLAFISGNGVARPRGFTTYGTAATPDSSRAWGVLQHIATGQAGAWPTTDAGIYDVLVDVVTALRPAYRRKARWLMSTEAINKLRKMKTATTLEPLWVPSVSEDQPDRLLGYPVDEAEQMPAIGANSLSVAFGDFKRGYWIGDRTGVRLLRDPYTDKPFVKFYTTKRVAGGVADSNAIKLLKFSAS